MGNCISCGEGVSREMKETIRIYNEKGIKRYVYRVNGSNWMMVCPDSWRLVHKKYNKNKKKNGYEYQNIIELK